MNSISYWTVSQLNQRLALCSSLKSKLAAVTWVESSPVMRSEFSMTISKENNRQHLLKNQNPSPNQGCTYSDINGVLYHKLLNVENYCRQLEALQKNYPSLVNQKGKLILHKAKYCLNDSGKDYGTKYGIFASYSLTLILHLPIIFSLHFLERKL